MPLSMAPVAIPLTRQRRCHRPLPQGHAAEPWGTWRLVRCETFLSPHTYEGRQCLILYVPHVARQESLDQTLPRTLNQLYASLLRVGGTVAMISTVSPVPPPHPSTVFKEIRSLPSPLDIF